MAKKEYLKRHAKKSGCGNKKKGRDERKVRDKKERKTRHKVHRKTHHKVHIKKNGHKKKNKCSSHSESYSKTCSSSRRRSCSDSFSNYYPSSCSSSVSRNCRAPCDSSSRVCEYTSSVNMSSTAMYVPVNRPLFQGPWRGFLLDVNAKVPKAFKNARCGNAHRGNWGNPGGGGLGWY